MSIRKISDYRVAREKSIKNSYIPKTNDTDFITKSSVTLLGVKTDKNINFNNHISTICQKKEKKRKKGKANSVEKIRERCQRLM